MKTIEELFKNIKDVYPELNKSLFNDPEDDVTHKIINLYNSINKNDTVDNVLNMIKFSQYYPSLTMFKPHEENKVIDAQEKIRMDATQVLFSKKYQNFNASMVIEKLSGENINKDRKVGGLFFMDTLNCLIKINKFPNDDKMSSHQTIDVIKFSSEGYVLDQTYLEYNDKNLFIKVGQFI